MIRTLDLYNIKGIATFKYKSLPNSIHIKILTDIYTQIEKRNTTKYISIFNKYGDFKTLKMKNNDLNTIEFNTNYVEDVLGYLLAHITNNSVTYLIIREIDTTNNFSIVYGFYIYDDKLYNIKSKSLKIINENSNKLYGLLPEQNIKFIDI